MATKAAPNGLVSILMIGDQRQVMRMLTKLNTSLDPNEIAIWLGAVVDPYIRKRARDRFKSEGDDVTGKWAPLLGPTQYIRSNAGFGAAHPINKRTGELEAYITGSTHRLASAPVATLTLPGKAPKGELFKKVKTAQRGRFQPPTVPRPVLGVNERDLATVMTELSLYLALGQMTP